MNKHTEGYSGKAPRGRQYAVTRLTHVAGPTAKAILHSRLRHDLLVDAQREAAMLDYRLNPSIILVEKEE
jgi:hypothetical protein